MPDLYLGNTAPLNATKPDEASAEVETSPLKTDSGWSETEYQVPPSEIAYAINNILATWYTNHSAEPPAWVHSDDSPALAELVAQSIQAHPVLNPDGIEIPAGRPKGWEGGPSKVAKGPWSERKAKK